MKVVSVEQIDITMSGLSQSAPLVKSVGNLAQSVVVGSWEIGSPSAGNIGAESFACDLWLSDVNTVNCQRNLANGTITLTAFVIEFDSSVTVQKGTFSMATTSTAQAIAAVDLTKSWAMHYARIAETAASATDDSNPSNRLITNVLTTATNLQLERVAAGGQVEGHWFVVSDPDLTVTQQTALQNVSALTQNTTLSAGRSVLLANTFLAPSHKSVEVRFNDEGVCATKLLNSTTIQARDSYSTSEVDTNEIFVVEDPAIAVQHFEISASASLGLTQTIAAVDLSRSIILPASAPGNATSTDYTAGNIDGRFIRYRFDSATQISWARKQGLASTYQSYQVIEFEQAVSSGTVVPIMQAIETATASNITPIVGAVISVGQVNETDFALNVTPVVNSQIPMSQVNELNLARLIAPTVGSKINLTRVNENDIAGEINPSVDTDIVLGLVTETSTALGFDPAIGANVPVIQVNETSSAFNFSALIGSQIAVDQAFESASPFEIRPVIDSIFTLGQTFEKGIAHSISSFAVSVIPLTHVTEKGNAFSVSPIVGAVIFVGQAQETDRAEAMAPLLEALLSIGQVLESVQAQSITPVLDLNVSIDQVFESSSAFSITPIFVAASVGGKYNASEHFPSGSIVTIEIYDPVSGDVIATDSAACVEIGNTGMFIWDSSKLNIQPGGYQEYAFRMTDGLNFEGGQININVGSGSSSPGFLFPILSKVLQ